ncbi:RDD family protein [Anaerococcus sp. AGMB00486]|uniref:RDD family protein n=2 Tax=Anaerococcus TaxID=165779 RepID=A0ABX2N9J7_9FIRM|nr:MULTISPECIES: RDD family protein [Anaerococcus]MDY3006575.1 RDD family protein [Anaerococcus porci]MSS77562.1 RDD family protein [Anaerococcus porci]NVF11234.1 RDD family protein [Anaerococcus faecalis]
MENVEKTQKTISIPKFAYAGFFIRLVAFTIDSIITSSIASIIITIFSVSSEYTLMGLEVRLLMTTVISLFYFFILTYLNNGQTLGKMVVGIRVISLYDEKLSFFDCLIREVFVRYIQNFLKILYLIIGFNQNKQSLADIMADTVVIKDDVVDYLFEY